VTQDGTYPQAITPQRRPQFPRMLSYVDLSALDMGDGGFRSLVKWLESLQEARRIWPFDPLEDEIPMKKIVIRFVSCGRSSRTYFLLAHPLM